MVYKGLLRCSEWLIRGCYGVLNSYEVTRALRFLGYSEWLLWGSYGVLSGC